MKSKDQLLLEAAYAKITSLASVKQINKLIQIDNKVIDELIEEGFGDFLKKVGSEIKGGYQKAKQKVKETVSSGIVSTLVKLIVSAIPKNELEQFATIVASGKIPSDKAKQVQDLVTQQPDAAQNSHNESYVADKKFLCGMVFTEENIVQILQTTNKNLFFEAEERSKNYRAGRELQQYAREVASKMNKIAALPDFNSYVVKYLTETTNNTPQQVPDSNAAAPGGNGLVSKIKSFVQTHPKISAAAGAALLGIVVAAFSVGEATVGGILITALKSAGIAGTSNIVKQIWKGEKFDYKQTGKAAAIGGALGAAGNIFAAGLGGLGHMFAGVFSGSSSSGNVQDSGEIRSGGGIQPATSSSAGGEEEKSPLSPETDPTKEPLPKDIPEEEKQALIKAKERAAQLMKKSRALRGAAAQQATLDPNINQPSLSQRVSDIKTGEEEESPLSPETDPTKEPLPKDIPEEEKQALIKARERAARLLKNARALRGAAARQATLDPNINLK